MSRRSDNRPVLSTTGIPIVPPLQTPDQRPNAADGSWPGPPTPPVSTPVVGDTPRPDPDNVYGPDPYLLLETQHSPNDQPPSSPGSSNRPASEEASTYQPQSPMAETGPDAQPSDPAVTDSPGSPKNWSNCFKSCCAPSRGSGATSST